MQDRKPGACWAEHPWYEGVHCNEPAGHAGTHLFVQTAPRTRLKGSMHGAAAADQAEWERSKREEEAKKEAEFNQPGESTMPRTKKTLAEYPVKFGGMSVTKSARIGVSISRNNLDLEEAERMFCGCRLTGTLIATPNGVDPDQKALAPGLEASHEISGVFDAKQFTVAPDTIKASLNFAKKDLNLAELAALAEHDGRVVITEVATLDEDEQEEGGEE